MNRKKLFSYILLLCILNNTNAQTIFQGDSNIVKGISEYLSSAYDKQDSTVYFITSNQFQKINTAGTKIYVDTKNKSIQRIGLSSMTIQGEFAEEYWYKAGKLIFVYQTFIYFKETPSLSKAINFQGMRYWESRYYLIEESVQCIKTTGTKEANITYSTKDLLNESKKIIEFLKKTQLKAMID